MAGRERPLGQTVLGVHGSAPATCCATSGRPLPPLGLSCIVSKDLSATLTPPSSRIPIDGVTTAYSDARVPLSSTTSHTHSHVLTRPQWNRSPSIPHSLNSKLPETGS